VEERPEPDDLGWAILRDLHANKQRTVQELADTLEKTRPTVSLRIQFLLGASLVELVHRLPLKFVQLTPQGENIVARGPGGQ
jgi:DNA-binding MarR family transcriptional regulator